MFYTERKKKVILDILAQHPKGLYGLDIVKIGKKMRLGFLDRPRRGSIHVYLGRMEDEGLVRSRKVIHDIEGHAIARRLYTITSSGKRYRPKTTVGFRFFTPVAILT